MTALPRLIARVAARSGAHAQREFRRGQGRALGGLEDGRLLGDPVDMDRQGGDGGDANDQLFEFLRKLSGGETKATDTLASASPATPPPASPPAPSPAPGGMTWAQFVAGLGVRMPPENEAKPAEPPAPPPAPQGDLSLKQMMALVFGKQPDRDAQVEQVDTPSVVAETTENEHSPPQVAALEQAPPSVPEEHPFASFLGASVAARLARASEPRDPQDLGVALPRDPAPEYAHPLPTRVQSQIPAAATPTPTAPAPSTPAGVPATVPKTPWWKSAIKIGAGVAGTTALALSARAIHRRFAENSREIAGLRDDVSALQNFVRGDPNAGADVGERLDQADQELDDRFADIDDRHRRD